MEMMQIPVFDGDNYEIWSIKMRTLLMARDLWDVVESGASVEKTLKIKDMTALHMLQMSVTDSLFIRIARATSSKQAWEILKEEFGETADMRSRKASNLWTKFSGMMMEKEESVVDYTKKLMEVVHQLKFYGFDTSDEEVIRKISCSLTSRFDGIARSLCAGNLTLIKAVWCLREAECGLDDHVKREASHNHNKRRRK
ncbi:hypothetical protein BRARA_D01215 [Brassica rapa]|uniref:Uncharacterized protein n=2 Tax=Brassica TaxID=3705 RepID=A0A397ZK73_BRACM|nr:uncharacterized protein LOC103849247 [Brassica rapa]XP_009124303.1 uncharacterized protein LOC103849247 [Brassica rapa]RID66049.1 hypothetical protein BRARA_D01215 [Brassica rapa]CAF2275110.1 unnamed protein product [Brassica napus]